MSLVCLPCESYGAVSFFFLKVIFSHLKRTCFCKNNSAVHFNYAVSKIF